MFAEQLTLLSFSAFRRIPSHELLLRRWMGDARFLLAPNAVSTIHNANILTHWMSTRILEQKEPKMRAAVICKLIAAGSRCVQLCNFNGAMQIVSSLTSSAVARLKLSWALVSPKMRDQLESLRLLVEATGNFKRLRVAQDEAVEKKMPCLPYLGLYLTDLVYVEEMPALLPSGAVNMGYLKSVIRVLECVASAQAHHFFALTANPAISEYILKHSLVCADETLLFEMSLKCEPREK